MGIYSTLQFIIKHPLNRNNKVKAITRFVKWQISNIFNHYPIIYPFTDRSKLIIKKGMTGATGNLYCGLHEYQDMAFLLHFLRKSDLFVDIGANIGSYTVLASAQIEAKTIAFEPVPSTYLNLLNNIYINNIQSFVDAYNIAIGSNKGEISFTRNEDTTNHVAVEFDKNLVSVSINTLDEMLIGQKPPVLMKIDVEGFETEVLNGASKTLINKDLKAIIIELNGSGRRYNYDESLIHEKLIDLGFCPFSYNPSNRTLMKIEPLGTNNTIYIRDLEFVTERLKTAEEIKILDVNI